MSVKKIPAVKIQFVETSMGASLARASMATHPQKMVIYVWISMNALTKTSVERSRIAFASIMKVTSYAIATLASLKALAAA